MRSSGQRKDGWWRRASTVQSPPSTSAESTAPSRMTPLLLDRSAGVASPHSAPPPLPHAAACSASLSDSTSSYSGYAGSPCGRANAGRAQRAGAEPGQPPRAPMGLWPFVACHECVLLCLQCVLLCFRRCSASSPKQGRTRPSPTRLTALLRAFSNGKRQSSRKSPTLQRPIEVAIDCSEHRALQTVLRLAGVKCCMRAAWLHSGCGSRELRGDSVEDERLSLKVSG